MEAILQLLTNVWVSRALKYFIDADLKAYPVDTESEDAEMIDEDATQPEWIVEVDEIVQATS